LNYTSFINGQPVAFDGGMQAWLEQLLPTLLREMPLNVPARVARYRERGGVPAVLDMIAQIRSTGARREHYQELLKGPVSNADAELIAAHAARDLAGSSGDLSSVLQKLPRSALQSRGTRDALVTALASITSSGDRASTLEILAPNADPDLLVILAQAAEGLGSSGDKANYLIVSAAEYLTPRYERLRNAFFHAALTVPSSGDLANVLQNAMAYGHADPAVTMDIIDASRKLASSGDAANVLMMLTSSRLLQPSTPRATLAAIQRTLTMASSGDRANVLMLIATAKLLTNAEIRNAYMDAATALPSDGDRANALAAAARQ
jgi:hypothetical protein